MSENINKAQYATYKRSNKTTGNIEWFFNPSPSTYGNENRPIGSITKYTDSETGEDYETEIMSYGSLNDAEKKCAEATLETNNSIFDGK